MPFHTSWIFVFPYCLGNGTFIVFSALLKLLPSDCFSHFNLMTAIWLEFLCVSFFCFFFFPPAVVLRFVVAFCWSSAASKLLWILHDVRRWLLVIIYISCDFYSLYLFSLRLILNISFFGIACGSCKWSTEICEYCAIGIICQEPMLLFGMVQYLVMFYLLVFDRPATV